MMEFKRKVFKFKLDGDEFFVKHPTVRQIEVFQADSKKVGDDDSIKVAVGLLVTLGLKEDFCYGLEPDHLMTIIEHVSGQKKS